MIARPPAVSELALAQKLLTGGAVTDSSSCGKVDDPNDDHVDPEEKPCGRGGSGGHDDFSGVSGDCTEGEEQNE
jgi:hypothetical protein